MRESSVVGMSGGGGGCELRVVMQMEGCSGGGGGGAVHSCRSRRCRSGVCSR